LWKGLILSIIITSQETDIILI